MTTNQLDGRKGERLAFVAYVAALLMTIWAVLLNVTTFATSDYTWILIEAIAFAGGAMTLLVFAWRRIPTPGRVIAASLVLLDLWVLWNAGVERFLRW